MSMASTLETVIAKLEMARLRLKLNEIEEVIDKLIRLSAETKIDIATESKTQETLCLAAQLAEFVRLSEQYANTLELSAKKARDDIPSIRAIQNGLQLRERGSKEAMKLCIALMRFNLVK